MSQVDDAYQNKQGLRWWPENELARFIGKTYNTSPYQTKIKVDLRALDIGCGTGRNMWLLQEAGFDTFGIDSSLDAVQCAKIFLSDRWVEPCEHTVQHSALPTIPFSSEEFDLVVDCQTIQHLSAEDHVKTYVEVARVLRTGGRFWSMHWFDGHAEELYDNWYPELRCWPFGELLTLVNDAGLAVMDDYRVERVEDGETIASWWILSMVKA